MMPFSASPGESLRDHSLLEAGPASDRSSQNSRGRQGPEFPPSLACPPSASMINGATQANRDSSAPLMQPSPPFVEEERRTWS